LRIRPHAVRVVTTATWRIRGGIQVRVRAASALLRDQ
jgi:hypothetical protein